jgi:hypothetical protein
LSKGQRLPLANLAPAGKLSDERYMTFFNQPHTPCGGVEARAGSGGDMAAFDLQLARLPAGIDRLVVTASIDGDGVMSQLQAGHVRLQAGDGGTSDQATTEKQLRWASNEPIFWQFMGIGKGRKSKSKFLAAFADSDFPFLEKLDELQGRLVDNANNFSVSSPDEHSDAELYDLLMTEYPGWLKLARGNGLLR